MIRNENGWNFGKNIMSAISPREQDFVMAANCVGSPNLRIMIRHILPMALGPIIVESTLEMGWAIMEEAGLSFLGFGIQPPTPAWGSMVAEGHAVLLDGWWLNAFPGAAIAALVARDEPLVAILWGRDARSLAPALADVPAGQAAQLGTDQADSLTGDAGDNALVPPDVNDIDGDGNVVSEKST